MYMVLKRLLKLHLIAGALVILNGFGACAHPANNNSLKDTAVVVNDTQALAEDTPSACCSDTAVKAEEVKKPRKVSILGDSYSTFEGYIPKGNIAWYKPVPKEGRPTDVTKVDQTWWKIFIDRNGYELEKNNSYSGATVCNTGYGKKDYTSQSFVTRLSDLGNPDLILIFGGTNDSWADSPIGSYVWKNWTKKDLYSYRPATAYMLSKLQEQHPDAEIIMIINDELKPEIVESTKTICDHYGVKYLVTDHITKMSDHPDQAGMISLADQLQKVLNK